MTQTDDLSDLFGAVRDSAEGLPFELFHRNASSLTVRMRGLDAIQVDRGIEDGVALRIQRPSPNGVVFAAASGCDPSIVRDLIESSRFDYGEVAATDPWPEDRDRLEDLEPSIELPEIDQARQWLSDAIEQLESQSAPAGLRCDRIALEIAATTESWAASPGRRMTRTRCRAFAVAHLRAESHQGPIRPLRIAARHWNVLSPGALVERLADRGTQALPSSSSPLVQNASLLFNPESAGALVTGLVARGAVPPSSSGSWREDPTALGALFGSTFDDAGYPAQPRRLIHAAADPIYLSRPSFRDRPSRRWSDLWIDPVEVGIAPETYLITALRVHDDGAGGLLLEVAGARMLDGRPQTKFRQGRVRCETERLLGGFRGGVGPARSDGAGVTTPALRFDGLRLLF